MSVVISLSATGAKVKDVTQTVDPTLTGPLLALTAKALSGTPTWTIDSQSADNNLVITSGSLGPVAPIGAGISQWAIVRATSGNDFVGFKVTLTGAGTAANPSLDFSDGNNSQYFLLGLIA